MPAVRFTRHLERFFPGLSPADTPGSTIAQVIAGLEARHPGLTAYLLDDHGGLRKHVNVFVDGRMIRDRERLSDPVRSGSEVYVMQALSGG